MTPKIIKRTNIKGSIKFVSKSKSEFYPTLKKRVDEYFINSGISKFGNTSLYIKASILLLIYCLPFAFILSLQPGWVLSLTLWVIMGLGIAGLGMGVMHDGNHESFSSLRKINFLMGHVLNLIGGSTYNWKMQHNILHHTYTNIHNLDEDIASKPAIRLSPHSGYRRIYRFQWIHGFFLYGLTTLFWVTVKDFFQYFRYKKNGANALSDMKRKLILFKLIGLKSIYFFTFFALPILITEISILQLVSGFLLMHFTAGLLLTLIFQLAHSIDGTAHPLPNENGIVENDWALHQLNTTMNFCPKNKVLSWFIGGLNFQIEHHLFPKISHVHYNSISKIVKNTAIEFGVPYKQHKSFSRALMAHISYLKKLGKAPNLMGLVD